MPPSASAQRVLNNYYQQPQFYEHVEGDGQLYRQFRPSQPLKYSQVNRIYLVVNLPKIFSCR